MAEDKTDKNKDQIGGGNGAMAPSGDGEAGMVTSGSGRSERPERFPTTKGYKDEELELFFARTDQVWVDHRSSRGYRDFLCDHGAHAHWHPVSYTHLTLPTIYSV